MGVCQVIRFNRGTTAGFEAHVGRRTTIRFVNRNNLGFTEPTDAAVLQHVTAPDAFVKFAKWMQNRSAAPRPEAAVPVYAIDPHFHQTVLDASRYLLDHARAGLSMSQPPTNGLYGVVFAAQRCQRVSLYGFARKWGVRAGPPERPFGHAMKYHYFDAEEPITAQRGRDNQEFIGLERLVNRGSQWIRFLEPCISGCSTAGCPTCPQGSQCWCRGGWHPVPQKGWCYRSLGGLQHYDKCADEGKCPGGLSGFCHGRP